MRCRAALIAQHSAQHADPFGTRRIDPTPEAIAARRDVGWNERMAVLSGWTCRGVHGAAEKRVCGRPSAGVRTSVGDVAELGPDLDPAGLRSAAVLRLTVCVDEVETGQTSRTPVPT